MASKEFSNKLKDLRLKAGYSQKDVYEYFHIPQSTFSSWEVGKSEPSGEMLLKLCEFYKCDMMKEFSSENTLTYKEWNLVEKYRFITESSPDGAKIIDIILNREYTIAEKLKQAPAAIVELHNISNEKSRLIDYYRSVSAGSGEVIFDDVYSERITLPDIPEYRRVAYAVKVDGKSMEPRYNDGDILLIEPTCEVEVGEIGIFNVDGKAYVKKLGKEKLISLNKGYGDIQLTEDSLCMGRVVGKLESIEKS